MLDSKTLDSFVEFQDGKFYELAPTNIPKELTKTLEEQIAAQGTPEPDMGPALSLADGIIVETFGLDVEYVHIWKFPKYWFVEYWDGDATVARIVIWYVSDYLEFQAKWLNSICQKIMAASSYHEWRDLIERGREKEEEASDK